MDRRQMEMLSVKSAVERTVQGYLASYTKNGNKGDLYNELCRYMAGLFASKQINRDYLVSLRDGPGNLEVRFSVGSHISNLTFMLPRHMVPSHDGKLDAAIADATQKLLSQQEPLGEEFQKVLDENRWDLYSDANE